LLEYLSDDRSDIGRGLGPTQRRKPFVNRLTHHIRQGHATRTKRLCLAKSIGQHCQGHALSMRSLCSRRSLQPGATWTDHMQSWTQEVLDVRYRRLASTRMFSTMLLQSDAVAKACRMITCMRDFGAQGYFVNIPSEVIVIQPDGKTFWRC